MLIVIWKSRCASFYFFLWRAQSKRSKFMEHFQCFQLGDSLVFVSKICIDRRKTICILDGYWQISSYGTAVNYKLPPPLSVDVHAVYLYHLTTYQMTSLVPACLLILSTVYFGVTCSCLTSPALVVSNSLCADCRPVFGPFLTLLMCSTIIKADRIICGWRPCWAVSRGNVVDVMFSNDEWVRANNLHAKSSQTPEMNLWHALQEARFAALSKVAAGGGLPMNTQLLAEAWWLGVLGDRTLACNVVGRLPDWHWLLLAERGHAPLILIAALTGKF